MKFILEDYKVYCKKNNLKEGYYTSLAQFKKAVQAEKELKLIKRHLNNLSKIASKDSTELLLGGLR